MKKLYIVCVFSFICLTITAYEPAFINDPAISPDGSLITFVYMGNLWEVPFEGGEARRLTAGEGRTYKPAYTPDGKYISFHSDKSGLNGFYRLPTTGGPAELLSTEGFVFNDWYPDSKSILAYISFVGEPSIFVKYDINGDRPLEIVGDGDYFATISSDGNKIVYNRRGEAYRPAYRGSHNGELWLYTIDKKEFTRLTDTELTERYPKFSRTNPNRLYFAASDGNNFQLFYMDDFNYANRVKLTDFKDWSVRDISIAVQNDRIVFEHFNEIWRYDPQSRKAEKVIIDIMEDNFAYPIVTEQYKNELSNGYVSDNQELLVFSQKFDLFAVPVKGGKVRQITTNQKGIGDIAIMSDNETIYFTSFEKGTPKLFKTNIKNTKNIEKIKWSDDKYIQSLGEEDGKLIIFYDKGDKINERRLFATLDNNNKITEILTNENIQMMPITSKDKTKMLYTVNDPITETSILRLKDIKTNTSQDLLFTTSHISALTINDAQTHIAYITGSRRGNSEMKIVSLMQDTTEKDDNWDKIITPAVPRTPQPENKTWDITFENFSLRSKTVVSSSEWLYPILATNDSLLYYVTHSGNSRIIRSIKFDGTKREDIYTHQGMIYQRQISSDNAYFYYVSNNKMNKVGLKDKKHETIAFEYDYTYNTDTLNKDIFDQVWARFGHFFYDPKMHNQDWNKIYNKFLPYLENIKNESVLSSIVDEMIGLVNASHTGFYVRSRNDNIARQNITYTGFVPDYRTRPEHGIKIKKIYHGSELYQKYGVRDNDTILEINDQPILPATEVNSLFLNLIGKNLKIKVQKPNETIDANIKGLSAMEQYNMRYADMVLNNYRKVQQLSKGKIGYLHIQGMDQPSLRKFEQDFLAVNIKSDAMIIDVRGNGGGHTHNDVIDIISREHNSLTYSRYWGAEPLPAPRSVYQKPIVLLINEDSYSDAEVLGTLFKDLNLGTIIGMPTSGSVIGTGSESFMDGSSMRMPSSGWFGLDKRNMENRGAKPDIEVPLFPQHRINNQDPQIEKAVEVLLQKSP